MKQDESWNSGFDTPTMSRLLALKLVVLIEKYFGHTREIAKQITFECRDEQELDSLADAITEKFQELKQERKLP